MARGSAQMVGSVYDRDTILKGNFDIWANGYAKTDYASVVKPLSEDQDEWPTEAGLDWNIDSRPCYYEMNTGTPDEVMMPYKGRKVLVREDTSAPLAIVSDRYKPVQPADILQFFGEITDKHDFKLVLAGEAMGGKRIFAMAECPQAAELQGGDKISNHLMMVTHNDGTGATRCWFTSVRWFCLNQLPVMINDRRGVGVAGSVARQTHGSDFDIAAMQQNLQTINADWANFIGQLAEMQKVKLAKDAALEFCARVFGKLEEGDVPDLEALSEDRTLKKVMTSYQYGEGQRVQGTAGTLYGLVNGITRFLDHDSSARSAPSRLERNWLGAGRKLKEDAYKAALELIS